MADDDDSGDGLDATPYSDAVLGSYLSAVITLLDDNPNIRVWSRDECLKYITHTEEAFRLQLAIHADLLAADVIAAFARKVRIYPQVLDRLRVLAGIDRAPPRLRPK